MGICKVTAEVKMRWKLIAAVMIIFLPISISAGAIETGNITLEPNKLKIDFQLQHDAFV